MASPLDFLHGIDVIEVVDATRPIRTVRSSVVGLVGTAGKGGNAPVLILGSRREAVAAFGRNRNDGFTIPAALDAIFDQVGAMVVVINAMPTENNTAEIEASEEVKLAPNLGRLAHGFVSNFTPALTGIFAPVVIVTAGQVSIPSGATLTSVKNAATGVVIAPQGGGGYSSESLPVGLRVIVTYSVSSLTAGTDYVLNAEEGTITRVSGGKLLPNATFTVTTYDYIDPSICTSSDIIGEVTDDGQMLGIQGLIAAKANVFVQPRIIVAPGFTHTKPDAATRNPVVSELLTIIARLKAVAVVDCPNTNREEAIAHRTDFEDDRLYFHYPWYRVLAPGSDGEFIAQAPSARIAGIISRADNESGFWFSPSNRQVNGIVGITKPIDFSLNDPNCEANYLNSNWVSTTIYEQGFRLWGNRVSSGTFLSVRRTADMVEESVMYAHLWAVDQNITRGYVESIVNGVEAYLRYLTSVGAILGGRAWADRELNTPTVLADGHLFIDFEFTAAPPAERVTFRAHLVNTYLSEVIAVEADS